MINSVTKIIIQVIFVSNGQFYLEYLNIYIIQYAMTIQKFLSLALRLTIAEYLCSYNSLALLIKLENLIKNTVLIAIHVSAYKGDGCETHL